MAYKAAFNTTSSPVVIDPEGHVLGGGEWGAADSNHDTVKAMIESGALVWSKDASKEQKQIVEDLKKQREALAKSEKGEEG